MKRMITILLAAFVVLILFLVIGPFYVIQEGDQAVVTRFGKIVSTVTDAGLRTKVPFVDTVVRYPKKILSWDGDAQRIPTLENQFIWVDATARWRIEDPQKFYESVTTLEQGFGRLDDVIDSSVRTVISQNPLREAVRSSDYINSEQKSPLPTQTTVEVNIEDIAKLTQTAQQFEIINRGRRALSEDMLARAAKITPQYGIKLVDLIIRQIRYSDDLTTSVYDRMIKERSQIAAAYRSYGEGQKAEWLGKLENERKNILSGAYKTSEEIKGSADATATQIYADTYRTDPQFFQLWRSLESYKQVLPELNKTMTTGMDYFRYLYGPDGR
ncbi:MAG TPA: protease modulator HflC [Spirochaetia bacterium]|nr:protease modulator HflC [Spirochaetia bacterium]